MDLLIVGCIAFLATHLGVSGTPLRKILIDVMGQQAYLGLYSVASFATLGLMIYGYSITPHTDFLWAPSPIAYQVAKVLVFIAFLILVMGAFTKNPTQVMNEQALDVELSGMLKITRHPIQWSFLIFAVGHLIANGDVASVMLFGTVMLLSFFGMLSMDDRKRKETDERWQKFMESTSMVPFAAIIGGRTNFTAADINWVAIVVAIVLYALVYWFHGVVSGGVPLI